MITPVHRARAALNLSRVKIVLILAFARGVHTAMSAATERFPDPAPTLAVLGTQTTALDLAQQAIPQSPRGMATPARNAARDLLMASLHSLRSYVQTIADADPANSIAIIKSAGFNVALVAGHPKAVLAAVATGIAGEVKLTANVSLLVAGSTERPTFNWQYSLDGGHTWVPLPSSPRANTLATGLPVLTNVSFRVSVTLGATMQPWAQFVTIPVH